VSTPSPPPPTVAANESGASTTLHGSQPASVFTDRPRTKVGPGSGIREENAAATTSSKSVPLTKPSW
jgi:hypothetical protein